MGHHTVILANGEFPARGGTAWRLLESAKFVVCCDGAANAYRRRFRRWPEAIIGDLDSFEGGRATCQVVHVADQDTNDLEKAMIWCARRGWKSPVIVGAAGGREDHALGNVFRALDHGCEIVTDGGRFIPLCGKATFKTVKGAAVSVFAPCPETHMTSKGLEWPLDKLAFKNLYCATLNRAKGTRITLTSDKPVSVFIEERTAK